jgi:hypothetical protein
VANALNNYPMIIDTDIVSYRAAAPSLQGIRVNKLSLVVGLLGISVAGTVVITAPSDASLLYPPLVVPVGQGAGTILYTDDPTAPNSSLTWRDFAVTGITGTGARLYLWYEV